MSSKSASATKFKFIEAMFGDRDLSPPAKCVVAILLLKFHNSRTGQCNPSVGAIAKAIGRQRRATMTAVAELKSSGWVEIVSTGGGSRRSTNRYKFDFSRTSTAPLTGAGNCTGAKSARVQKTARVQKNVGRVQDTAHEPLKNPLSPFGGQGGVREGPARRPAPDGAGPGRPSQVFAEFWQHYPKQQGQDGAARAFSEVVEAGADPRAIIAGAMRYGAERAGKPARFTAAPANWLRDGRWKDAPEKPDPHHRNGSNGYHHRRGKVSLVDEVLRAGGFDIGGRS